MLYLKIVNDGTGDENTGNYDFLLALNAKILHSGRIEGFDRNLGAEVLLFKITSRIMNWKIQNIRGTKYKEIADKLDDKLGEMGKKCLRENYEKEINLWI